MYSAQLIEIKETTLYMKDGKVIATPTDATEKLHHTIFGETKTMKSETVIERWNLKTKKEANAKFWAFCEQNKVDFRNYYVVFAD